MIIVLVVLWPKDGIYWKLFILINADCSKEAYIYDFHGTQLVEQWQQVRKIQCEATYNEILSKVAKPDS
jgi:hypothetical protein